MNSLVLLSSERMLPLTKINVVASLPHFAAPTQIVLPRSNQLIKVVPQQPINQPVSTAVPCKDTGVTQSQLFSDTGGPSVTPAMQSTLQEATDTSGQIYLPAFYYPGIPGGPNWRYAEVTFSLNKFCCFAQVQLKRHKIWQR